jgi:phosphoglycolate phosphatase
VGGAVPSDEQAAYVIGMGLMQALAHAAPDVPPERYPELGARYRHHYLALQDDISLFDGVLPLLADLRPATMAGSGHRQVARRAWTTRLRSSALQGVFDGSRTADETAGKPHPRMLHELMREFGVEPGRTLMIGDTTHDLQMAANAGCASVAVSYGAHEPDAFHAHPRCTWRTPCAAARLAAGATPEVPWTKRSRCADPPTCGTAAMAVPFDVVYGGQTCRAFAIRYRGRCMPI